MATFWLLLRRFTRALWFLPALFSVAAVAVVAVALFSNQFLPDGIGEEDLPLVVSTDAVRSILSIVASSMLAVAVFALSTLVTLLTTAAQTGSPRAVPLIVADRAAQTSISVFVGAFLFSIVGIIGLSGEFYTTSGRLILFVSTLFVILAVVWALLRWIQEISVLGRVDETIQRTEKATRHALKRVGPGALYGCSPRRTEPTQARAVKATRIGFVQHIDPETLQGLAEEEDLRIHVAGRPGDYVDFGSVLAWVEGEADEEQLESIGTSFLVGAERTFEYDPGYGLIVLADIARRALSPGINDPNTAVHVLTVQTRLLGEWARDNRAVAAETIHDRVTLAPMDPSRLMATAFRDIARDAAGSLDATLAVLRGLRTLAETAPEDLSGPASAMAADIALRAEEATRHEPDLRTIREAAQKLTQPPRTTRVNQ